MANDIKITINDKAVKELLNTLAGKMQNLRPVMIKLAGDLHDSVEENFAEGGRPSRWKPSHRALAQGGRTLQDTGRLAGSILPTATDNRAILGTNIKYAGTMQFGAKKGEFGKKQVVVHAHRRLLKNFKKKRSIMVREHTRMQALPWGTIPPRPFLMVQDEDWKTMKDTLTKYLFTL